MTDWLDPLRRALDATTAPTEFFFRDDDAGWRDDRLLDLLDLFAAHETPVDLAVIPTALGQGLARVLRRRAEDSPVGLHQHGYAHENREPAGRKCEFGPSRAKALQRADIAAGRDRLSDLLGPYVAPVFTPPWNRCSVTTGECLVELGFRAVSRLATDAPLGVPGLDETPVHVDWLRRRKGVRLERAEIGELLADELRTSPVVGVMLHHAEMDSGELASLAELLTLVGRHPSARTRPMFAACVEETTC